MDLYDAGTGRLLQQLVDPNFTHISPVNKPHPRLDVIISGASRSLYAWRPVPEGERGVLWGFWGSVGVSTQGKRLIACIGHIIVRARAIAVLLLTEIKALI